jgi:hypothetical protein
MIADEGKGMALALIYQGTWDKFAIPVLIFCAAEAAYFFFSGIYYS